MIIISICLFTPDVQILGFKVLPNDHVIQKNTDLNLLSQPLYDDH